MTRLLLFFLAVPFAMSAQTTQKDEAVQGFIDLKEYAFTTEEPVRLTSQWEFYGVVFNDEDESFDSFHG